MAIGVKVYFIFYFLLLKKNISKAVLSSSVKSKVLKHNFCVSCIYGHKLNSVHCSNPPLHEDIHDTGYIAQICALDCGTNRK
jgi:hypothetical protein